MKQLEFLEPTVKEIINNDELFIKHFASVIPKWDKKDKDIYFLLTNGTPKLR